MTRPRWDDGTFAGSLVGRRVQAREASDPCLVRRAAGSPISCRSCSLNPLQGALRFSRNTGHDVEQLAQGAYYRADGVVALDDSRAPTALHAAGC